MAVKERLKILFELCGYTKLSDFARAVGIEPGTAQQQASRGRIPYETARRYVKHAERTGVTIDWLREGRGTAPSISMTRPPSIIALGDSPQSLPRHFDLSQSPDIPLWTMGAISDAQVGATVHGGSPVEFTARPEFLRRTRTAFALRIWDEHNSPHLKQGDEIVFNKAQRAAVNDWCVFARPVENSEPDSYQVLIGILLGKTATGWKVQHGPKQPITIRFEDWPEAWKVVYIRPR